MGIHVSRSFIDIPQFSLLKLSTGHVFLRGLYIAREDYIVKYGKK
jgi:hypothetical protein